jgi:thiol-disulfide isomerase/thioredoxin
MQNKGPQTRALIVAAVLGLAGLWFLKGEGAGPAARVAEGAPDFRLSDLGGRTVTLGDYKGKIVLLNFWATWCDSCKEELPALNALYKRRKGDFELLAASVDQGGRKDVMAFVAAHDPAFPVLLADLATQQAYGVRDLPTSFLIAPDGRIARRYLGPIDPAVLENDILGMKSGPGKT